MRIIPLILAVALFMENMDSTVISTSLPAIAADIGTSPIALKLALTAYLVSLAIFIPISSWFADKYGAKRVFQTAIFVFMAGSIGCALAGSLGGFVVARFLQGMGGAMMTPVARLVLVRTTERRELVSAMAWLTVPALIGPMIGPPLGGFITTYFSWHWIFLINIPIGLIGSVLARIYLPHMEPLGVKPMDISGFIIVALAASGIVFGLSVVSLPALPPIVGIVTVIIGIVASIGYVFHARRVDNPILDLQTVRGHGLPRCHRRRIRVSHRQRRFALPAAAAVSARLRHDAVRVRQPDLCDGDRRDGDEVRRAGHFAHRRVSQRDDSGCTCYCRLYRR